MDKIGKRIYQSYQQQQQFTANAAPERRSPLASLLATVEAILRLPPTHQQDVPSMLQRVERQGRRLSHLIADLLLLVSLEQNSSPKPFQPCCLNDLIANAIQYTSAGGLVQVSLSQSDRTRHCQSQSRATSLAGAIAHRHQGHLKVNSELGRGSVFTICLPCIHRPITSLNTGQNLK